MGYSLWIWGCCDLRQRQLRAHTNRSTSPTRQCSDIQERKRPSIASAQPWPEGGAGWLRRECVPSVCGSCALRLSKVTARTVLCFSARQTAWRALYLYRALTEKVGEATSTEGCERRNRPPPPTPVSSSIRKPGARRVTLGGRAASGPRCLTCTPVVRPHTKEFCKEWTPAEKACYSRGLRCLNRGSPQTSRPSEVERHPAVLEKPQGLTGFSRTCHNRGLR